MSKSSGFFRRLGLLICRERFRAELDEEMAFHREQAQREFEADGMGSDAARKAAMRQFGNVLRMKERSHEEVGFRMESVWQDVRYAMRQLIQNPGFTVVITLTLALSIGANSAIFSVVNAVLLKPLPYPDADRLVRLFLSNNDFPKFPLNPWDFHDLRDRNRSFESMAAYTRSDVQLSGAGEPERLNAFGITSGYFHTLGLKPEIGREFDWNAEVPGNGYQVVISDRLWRSHLHADPGVIGRKITLDLKPYTIVGVMPQGTDHPGNAYHAMAYGSDVDVWWPFAFGGTQADRGSHFMEGIGRLRPGVTAEQAKAEMNTIMTELGREHDSDKGWQVLVIPLYEEIVGTNRRMLLVLLGAVGMVLLIACANAANLLLARASARQREVAVRLALGAPRARLIRQMLTESLLISLLGGVLGGLMAIWGVKLLVLLLPAGFPRANGIHVNAAVFGFTLLISVVTGVVFGLAPALQASRTDSRLGLGQGLHDGGRGATGGRSQMRLRDVLVIAEMSLACVLLIGAGLMLRSFLNLVHLNPGFARDQVLTATLSLPRATYGKPDKNNAFCEQLNARLATLPGVESSGVGSDLPWTGYDDNSGFTIEGKKPAPHEEFHARYHAATPNYFRALGIPLIRGRFFSTIDTRDSRKTVLVNQALANRYLPGEDIVGKRITFGDNPKESDWYTIVGVVGDVKDTPGSASAEPSFWWPLQQLPFTFSDMSLVVRAKGDSSQLVGAVREQVRQLDPTLAVADVRQMADIADASVSEPRFAFFLVGLFAALAIVLAAIGTYGVISYSVSQRIPEFGLRLALGAPVNGLLRMVMFQAARLAVAGTVIGLVAALTLARLLQSMIYEVSPADPLTFTAVGLMVIAVALLACYLPARRATKANPMVALRAE